MILIVHTERRVAVRLRNRRSVAVLVSLLGLLGVVAPLPAQTETASRPDAVGIITGRLVASGTGVPIVAGSVRVVGTTLGAPVRRDGEFVIRGVPVGIVRLETRAIGYAVRLISDVVVSAGKPAEQVIELTPVSTKLQGVVVKPSYFPALPPPSRAVSPQTLSAEEIRRTPGAQEDVLNVVNALPGVNGSTGPGRNDIVVRGGAAFENLFVIDNIELPNINHFAVQGSSAGAVALVGVSLVRDVSVSAGGFGVRDGDKVSSVT